MKNVLFLCKQCPGDAIVSEMAIRSLHLCCPGKYRTGFVGTGYDYFAGNTLIQKIDQSEGHQVIRLHHPAIHESHSRPVHFASGYIEHIGRELNEPGLQLKVVRPTLYLSKEEVMWKAPWEKYCVINNGGKKDFLTKIIGSEIGQKICDHLIMRGITPVQVGYDDGGNHHLHTPLKGAVNLIGKTNTRELMRLVFHSSFVICGVTMLLPMSAAFSKIHIVYYGGREPISWHWFPKQISLSTVGMLECCKEQACWKSLIDVSNPGKDFNCSLPVVQGDEVIAGCHALLGAEPCIEAIDRIIAGGLY